MDGNAKKNIKAFPVGAQKIIGDELQLMQFGVIPRVVAVQLGKKIYVLHAFQKKSTKGIATPKQEVDLIKQRYAEAKELAKNEEK